MMRRLLGAFFGLLLAWIGLSNVAEASAVVPSLHGPSYTYDAPSYDAPKSYTASERGPPVKGHAETTYDAVDLRSDGPSAPQSPPGPRATYVYDDITLLVQSAIVAGTTAEPAAVAGGVVSSFQSWLVAAKTGPALGPARNTNLVLDSFRKLGPGRNAHVRTAGSVDELQDTFNAWTVGAERIASRGPKVPDVYRLPDGGVIQWRTSSGTGGPTIDIFPVSGRQRTVHLADGVPW